MADDERRSWEVGLGTQMSVISGHEDTARYRSTRAPPINTCTSESGHSTTAVSGSIPQLFCRQEAPTPISFVTPFDPCFLLNQHSSVSNQDYTLSLYDPIGVLTPSGFNYTPPCGLRSRSQSYSP